MCKQHTHWYNLANASISAVSMCACVCLHVFVRVCVFIRLSDMLAVRVLSVLDDWSAMGREGNDYHQMILCSSLPFLVKNNGPASPLE